MRMTWNSIDPKTLRKDDEIAPDGVRIAVNWDELAIGWSVFVPCIATSRAKNQLNSIATARGIRLRHYICVEQGMYGIRIYRTL